VAIRHDQVERVVQQVGALQRNLGLRQRLVVVDQRQVQLPACQSQQQPLEVVVEHAQLDVGVALAEQRDGTRDERRDGGGEAGQPQAAAAQRGDLAELLPGLLQAGEHGLGMRHEGAAGVGEAHRSHAALHQPGARLPLKGAGRTLARDASTGAGGR
jgi:hypothetical protein